MNSKEFSGKTVADVFQFLRPSPEFEYRPPIDVDMIARLLGIRVEDEYFPNAPETVGQISFENTDPLILINPEANSFTPRRRFTLAHEIGHFVLHRSEDRHEFVDDAKTMSRSDSYWDRYESEANSFAAQILMPTDLVIRAAEKIIQMHHVRNGSQQVPRSDLISALARQFNVSSRAMAYRLADLRLVAAA
jgi:Zn-dependent peptidase ImmA (M78 family)